MKPAPSIAALSLLAALGLTGCHPPQPQMTLLPGTTHPAYTITDLGAGVPYDINNRGRVVGMYAAGVFPKSKGSRYFHGCLWEGGKRTDMPTLGGWYSNAVKVSDSGLVLGTANVAGRGLPANSVTRACIWDGVKLTNLDAAPCFYGASAIHVTKSGAVYAASPPQGPKKQIHLWLYPAGFGPGVRHDVGVIGGPKIKPMFINDNGMVAGTWNADGERHAFVWHRGDKKWTELGTFGGRESEPAGLNDAGQVIGDAMLTDDPVTHRWRDHAFLWEKGKMHDLGALLGGSRSRACAINSNGQIVGYSDFEDNQLSTRPVLWGNGQIKDLSRLIPSGTRWCNMSDAAGINDKGQIVGDGAVTDDQPEKGTYEGHAYLLTPR